MGERLVLLVPKLPGDLERPTPLMMRKALDQVVAAIGGAIIESKIAIDEDFDGLYAVIRALPSIQPEFGYQGLIYAESGSMSWGTIRTDNFGAALRMVESHHLGIALASEQAGKTWRNHAAERYFNALPPGLPVFLAWE